MKKILKSLVALVLLGGVSTASYGQAVSDSIKTDEASVFDFSLEELLNLEITVASKKAERISDAPGSITAYTSKDIENLGYYTLRDLADITSGYSSFRGIGEISFETRGQFASGGFDNNKHLVLVDGIPFSHTRANRANAEEDLPLFFANRVEFLKGPGSALYGISAFYGVMNIVSKDLEENGTKVESKFSLGNYDFKKRMMTNVIHKTDEGVSKISFALFAKDATRELLGNGTASQPYNANSVNYDDQNSVFANVSHKLTTGPLNGLKFGAIYSRKTGGLGDFWQFDQNQTYEINQLTWEQIVPYVKYENELTSKLAINSYVKGNISTENAYVGGWQAITSNGTGSPSSTYNVRAYDFEMLGEATYKLAENTNLIGGLNYVSRYTPGAPEEYAYFFSADPGLSFKPDPSKFIRSSTFKTYSTYLQGQQKLNFLKGTIITAGARLDMGRAISAETNKVVNQYSQLSPRIAVVQKVTDKLNVKLMYGAALRAPLIKEVGLNDEVKTRNPDIADQINDVSAETIKTYELAVTYNTDRMGLSATVFSNRTQDPIGKGPAPDGRAGQIQLNDTLTIKATGLEVDASVVPTRGLKVGSNVSVARATQSTTTDDKDLGDVYNVPTLKVNGYATYSFDAGVPFTVAAVGHFIDNYRAGGVTPWGNHKNQLLAGYKVFDANVMAQVTDNVSLEVQVRNVLNEKIITPTFYAANNLSIPGADRSVLVTLGLKF